MPSCQPGISCISIAVGGTDPVTPTDLEPAARFLYLQRAAFGGKVDGRSFGVDRPARFDITTLVPLLKEPRLIAE